MSEVVGSAVYNLTLDRSSYDRTLSGVEKTTQQSAKQITGHLSGLKSAFGGIVQTAAGFALGQGLVAGIGQLKSTINAASDLNETLNKSSVVFGDYARDVEAFGSRAAKSLGQSKEQAIAAAAGFGNLFVSMGMGKRPAADMSMSIVTLASDLASFNNLDPAEVLEGLRAGLVGETEPLRKFGVNVNQANIEARALKLGLMQAGGELTASAKAQATYSLILEQTTTAQGDFANTSTGMANSTRIIKAELTDMAAKVGTAVLPKLAPLVSMLAQRLPDAMSLVGRVTGPVIDKFLNLGRALKGPVIAAFTTLSGAIGIFATLIGDVVGERGDLGVLNDDLRELFGIDITPLVMTFRALGTVLGSAFGIARDAVKTFLQALSGNWTDAGDSINVIHRIVGNFGVLLHDQIIPAVQAVVGWLGDNLPKALSFAGAAFDLLGRALSPIVNFLVDNKDVVLAALTGIAVAFGVWTVATAAHTAATWLQVTAIAALNAVLSPVVLIMAGIAVAAGLLYLAWKNNWGGIQQIVADALPKIQAVLTALWTAVQWVVTLVKTLFAGDWSAAWAMLGSVVTVAKDFLVNTALPSVWAGIQSFFTTTLPLIIGQLAQWGLAFIQWVAPMIPPLLLELGTLLLQLNLWLITTALPTIVTKLAEWGWAFIRWVAPMIPPLLAELGVLLLRVGLWILTDALPTLMTKLLEWGVAFVAWVGPAIPPLLVELGKLLLRMGEWIVNDAIPAIAEKFLDMGTKAGAAIIDGILGGLGDLWHLVTELVAGKSVEVNVSAKGGGAGAAGSFGPVGPLGAASGSGFIKPVTGAFVQGSWTGTHSREAAMDWASPYGSAVVAPMSGTVSAVGWNLDGNSGRGLVIEHPGGWTTRYGHMSSVNVSAGDTVAQGSLIGYSGSPEADGGAGSGAHLHFALQRYGSYVDAAENYVPMAAGGILVGEAGLEAVLPLSPANPIPVDIVTMDGTDTSEWWKRYAEDTWAPAMKTDVAQAFSTTNAEQAEWWKKYAEETWGGGFVPGGGAAGDFYAGTAAQDLTDAINAFNAKDGAAQDLVSAIDTFSGSADGFVLGGGAVGKDFISGADKLIDAMDLLTDKVVPAAKDILDALNAFGNGPAAGWNWGGGAAVPGGVFTSHPVAAIAAETAATPGAASGGTGTGMSAAEVLRQQRLVAAYASGPMNANLLADIPDMSDDELKAVAGFALGGTITEPIAGLGLRTGRRYLLGEAGPETVTPGAGGGEVRFYGPINVYPAGPDVSLDDLIKELVGG